MTILMRWKQNLTSSSKYMDKDWLYNEYIVKNRSVSEISEANKIPRTTIIAWLDEHKIYRNWRRLKQLTGLILLYIMKV